MRVKAEAISPGSVVYMDPQGNPAVYEATPQKIKHFYDSGKRMLAKGLSIPAPLEHDTNAGPMTAQQKAVANLRNQAGEVADFHLENGTLFYDLEITDPQIAGKIRDKTIKFTSPYISNVIDGDGDQWNEVITHAALTSRPRLHRQQPIQSIAAALSLAKIEKTPSGIPLSKAGLLNGGQPLYPVAFSLWTGVKLSAEEMKKEMGKEKPKKPEGEKGKEKAPMDKEGGKEPPEEGAVPPAEGAVPGADGLVPMLEEALVDPDGDISVVDVICDLLEMMDPPIVMPPDTTRENFEERLYTAMMDHHKADKMTPEPEATMPNTPAPAKQPPINAEPPPLLMSLEQINAIPDQMLKSVALSLHEQAKSIECFKAKEFEAKKRTRKQRIDALAKFLSKELLEALTKQADSVQLSLTPMGDVLDPMELTLATAESVYNQIPIMLKTPSAELSLLRVPVENSDEAQRIARNAEAEKVADDLIERSCLPPAVKAKSA